MPQISTKAARKIVIIGDSHTRGLANSLNSVLTSESELFNLVKLSAGTDSLKESLTETVPNLTKEDVLVIRCGTNDMNQNNFNYTYINIKDYLLTLKNTKVLVLVIPFRYDLRNSEEINSKIGKINKKLSKLIQTLQDVKFLPSNNDSRHFTKQGLHRNKFGQQCMVNQIAASIVSIFTNNKNRNTECIPLPWSKTIEIPLSENQVINVKRSSNRAKK
jgi:hypothetical protein